MKNRLNQVLFIFMILFNNIVSMELSVSQNYRQLHLSIDMPEEVLLIILLNAFESKLSDYMKYWNDIFMNFDEVLIDEYNRHINLFFVNIPLNKRCLKECIKKELENMRLICMSFNRLILYNKKYFIEIIKRLKIARFNYLKDQIKLQYAKFSVNSELYEILNLDQDLFFSDKYITSYSMLDRGDRDEKIWFYQIDKESLKKAICLILAGADIDVQNEHGRTALMLAVKEGYNKLIQILLDLGANPNDEHGNTLIFAEAQGDEDIIKTLLSYKVNCNIPDEFGNTALIRAILSISKVILKSNKKMYHQRIKLLIDSGANVNFQRSIRSCYGCQRLKIGYTPLMLAVIYGEKDIIEMLINAGADVNMQDSDGVTALYLAVKKALYSSVKNNCYEIIEMLLKSGANVDIPIQRCDFSYFSKKTNDSSTLLIESVRSKNIKIVNLLILYNANVNLQDSKGLTALMWATKKECKNIVDILLKAYADISIKDNNGYTALNLSTKDKLLKPSSCALS